MRDYISKILRDTDIVIMDNQRNNNNNNNNKP